MKQPILAMVVCSSLMSAAWSQSTERVSVSSAGLQANAWCAPASISADGRFVAFRTASTNLVPGVTSGIWHSFVRDRLAGTVELADVSSSGVEGNSFSDLPSLSGDGRLVVFHSTAWNLVAGGTNGAGDVFVRDRVSGTTELVSVATGGAQGNGSSIWPSISADGRYVAFWSLATNLVAGDTNGYPDSFLRDRLTGTTERVSVGNGGVQADFGSNEITSISDDGRWVVFTSSSTNLVAGDTNGIEDTFVRDRLTGTTERVSVATGGAEGNGASTRSPSISADGRYVAFGSRASNLVPNDTNGFMDVFVRDRLSATTRCVSVDTTGAQGGSDSDHPSISADGRFVAFRSESSNLVVNDPGPSSDIFVRDLFSGNTEPVSVTISGAQATGWADAPSISADGRYVCFHSEADNLVANDTNSRVDVFVRDRGAAYSSTPFCFGDGTGTTCPCGNAGATGNGCANSIVAAGARLSANGAASVTVDTFRLAGNGMPNAAALYFQGTGQQAGGAGSTWGDGLRCARGSALRLATELNSGGSSYYPGAGEPAVSVRGAISAAGGTRTYQVWYRNAATGFCTPSLYNLTNGLSTTWLP